MAVFTQNQCKALSSDSDRLLMLAVAGSGKSTTLVQRVKYILESRKADPKDFLCITFTRKAAEEFSKKLQNEGIDSSKMTINTFHGTAYSLLTKMTRKLYSIVEESETESMIKRIARFCGFKKTMTYWKEQKKLWCQRREKEMSIEGTTVIKELYSAMIKDRCIDFDYIIPSLLKLIEKDSKKRAWLEQRFKYVFIDEYQDTDDVQQEFINALKPEMLTCVGDADQSIYSFRNADVKLIIDMSKDPATETVKLDDCFRCKKNIVETANRIIKTNQNRIDVEMKSAVMGGDGIVEKFESVDTYNDVADRIKELVTQNGVSPSDIAVISRNHVSLCKMADCLNNREEDFLKNYSYTGKKSAICNHPYFKGVMAIARLALNSNNRFAFLTAVDNLLYLDERKVSYAFIQHNKNPEQSLYTMPMPESETDLETWLNKISWKDFVMFVKDTYTRVIPSPETVEEICAYPKEGMSFMEVMQYKRNKDIYGEQEEEPDYEDSVTLITSHASKGLEWGTVIVLDMDKDVFPSKRNIEEGNKEEETRLAYVTFTRAKTRLIVTCHKGSASEYMSYV